MRMAHTSPKGLKTLLGKGEIARYEQFLLPPLPPPPSVLKRLNCRHIKTRAYKGKG